MLHVGLRTSIYFAHGKVNYGVQGHVLIIKKIACDIGQSEGFVLTQTESNVHTCMHY